jgi:FkbH-like protein
MTELDPLKVARQRAAAGELDAAVAGLAAQLRAGALPPLRVEAAGRWLQRALPEGGLRVRVLGELTTGWLAPMLQAWCAAEGPSARVRDGGFDVVMQELMALSPGDVDAVVLVPWCAGRDVQPEAELARWQAAWDQVRRVGARLVMVGLDLPGPGPDGALLSARPGGLRHRLRAANAALQAALPPGAAFIDLDAVAGELGRAAFYDARRWYWTKQPLSEAGAARLARHLAAGLRALVQGPRKVLVLDCDHTLWGGVVGELGPLGVQLGESADGEAFRAFQRWCLGLRQRGILLAVATKNEPADARGPFEQNPAMVLQMEHIAAFEAGWGPKSEALRRIAARLNLGVDALAFFDDNPAEREQVRQALPEVAVIDVPADPSDYVRAIEDSLAFEAAALTAEDAARAAQYQAEAARQDLAARFDSLDDYLQSLEMVGELGPIDAASLPRVAQLLGKTNQWNLTTRRHSEAQVEALLAVPGAYGRTLSLRDRFGDHGLVGVILAVPDGEDLRVDTWLMSCRVIARTAEHFAFADLLAFARAQGARRLVGDYLPTRKNPQVAGLYADLGLEPAGPTPGEPGGQRFTADPAALPAPRTFVRPA